MKNRKYAKRNTEKYIFEPLFVSQHFRPCNKHKCLHWSDLYIIASIIYRTSDCQEELSANNRKHTEDYVLEEFNKSTEVLSLPLPNPDGTFNGKSSFVDKIMAWFKLTSLCSLRGRLNEHVYLQKVTLCMGWKIKSIFQAQKPGPRNTNIVTSLSGCPTRFSRTFHDSTTKKVTFFFHQWKCESYV